MGTIDCKYESIDHYRTIRRLTTACSRPVRCAHSWIGTQIQRNALAGLASMQSCFAGGRSGSAGGNRVNVGKKAHADHANVAAFRHRGLAQLNIVAISRVGSGMAGVLNVVCRTLLSISSCTEEQPQCRIELTTLLTLKTTCVY